MSKILILGKDGQVGRALVKLLGKNALAAGKGDINFLDTDFISTLEKWVGNQSLSAVINAAAYTQVDKAEGDSCEAAFRINATAVGELAAWCKKRDVPLVHYSTDYIFNGNSHRPYQEEDKTAPINAYGESKLEGENAIKTQGGKYIIFRTSWVYDAHGKNFFTTILRLLHEKDSLNVVADQIGAPTYALHLAQATLKALPLRASGLFHLCNAGETSWHGFAQAIFTLAKPHDSSIKCRQINPIPTSAYPLPAPRPLNSRLNCTRAREILGFTLPSWEMGLKECIEEVYADSGLQNSGAKNHPARRP